MRIIYRVLPTREFLHDRKIVNDPICPSCNLDTHTIQHLLWHCDVAQVFWKNVNQVLIVKCNHLCNMNISEDLIFFEYEHSITDYIFFYIIILEKYYIYISYMKGNLPNVKAFLALLKRKYCELKYMACAVNELILFETNWAPYCQLVQWIKMFLVLEWYGYISYTQHHFLFMFSNYVL